MAEALRPAVEQELRALLKLRLDLDITGHSPLDLGLSSLGAITLQYRLETELGAEVPISDILGAPTVGELSIRVAAHLPRLPEFDSSQDEGVG
jgi:acyl carrier protein